MLDSEYHIVLQILNSVEQDEILRTILKDDIKLILEQGCFLLKISKLFRKGFENSCDLKKFKKIRINNF